MRRRLAAGCRAIVAGGAIARSAFEAAGLVTAFALNIEVCTEKRVAGVEMIECRLRRLLRKRARSRDRDERCKQSDKKVATRKTRSH
jgi:hypothetical protein